MSPLISTLLKKKLITPEQLNKVIEQQKLQKRPLQDLLVAMGFLKEEDLVKALSGILRLPVLRLKKEDIDKSAIELVPYEVAKRYDVFPIREEKGELLLAISNPNDVIALDDLKLILKRSIKPILATKTHIRRCIEKYYRPSYHSVDNLLQQREDLITIEKVSEDKEDMFDREELFDEQLKVDSAPVVRLTNIILNEAVKLRATDIHIEPQERYVDVRYRIDGVLRSVMKIQPQFRASLAARMKILTTLDISETRKPQDGRTRVLINGRKIDLRISAIPTFYGEKIALRLLDKSQAKIDLSRIGLESQEEDLIVEAIVRPQGMILVTGPTGSGKTSTLYAALNFIRKSGKKNIITIEDPIEYLMEGVNQMQVNPTKDLTFANGLRSILRQDPNVILVGEVRDRETASIAFRSSLTGHLVLSTLHTNSAVSTITRLFDIGVDPYLVASSIILIIAQRLIRKICPSCREKYIPESHMMLKFKSYIEQYNIERFYRGKGCDKCEGTGFLGRTGVFEILKINDRIKYLISLKSPEAAILAEAEKINFRPLLESGIAKVAAGITTLEEISRVLDITDAKNNIAESKLQKGDTPRNGKDNTTFLEELGKRFFSEKTDE